jgi:hypothetical protein
MKPNRDCIATSNHKVGDLVYSFYCGLGVIREVKKEGSILSPAGWIYKIEWMNDIYNKGNYYTDNQVLNYKKFLESKLETGTATEYVK